MKRIGLCLIAAGVLTLSGCVEHERTVVERQSPGTTVERDVIVTDGPHVWWNEHYPGEPFDRDQAVAAHRAWCEDHAADASCAAW